MTVTFLGAAAMLVRRRAAGSTDARGVYTAGGETTFNIVASLQPFTTRERLALPGGDRVTGLWHLFTTSELHTVVLSSSEQPDRVEHKGKLYQVDEVEDYTDHTTGLPHFHYTLRLVGQDERP